MTRLTVSRVAMASAFKPFTGGNGHTITAEERANAQGVNALAIVKPLRNMTSALLRELPAYLTATAGVVIDKMFEIRCK